MWVDVAADQHLVAEAICAALGSRGIQTAVVDWVSTKTDPVAADLVPAPRVEGDAGPHSRLLLMVCDLDVPGRLWEAGDLGRRFGVPWLVVDVNRPGPAWGGLLEAGASTVVSSVSLDELVSVLDQVAAGGSSLSEVERRTLVRQWLEVKDGPDHAWRQMMAADEHDREILAMLYQGTTVSAIANRYGVSEAAVRNQVKAALRRLWLTPR